jgi:ABC-type glycerol-3-phosphate transport system substrate-binding protein
VRIRIRMIVVILACAGAAACGGGSASSASQPTRGPAIPKAVATDLAARADAVAVSLDAQRGCAALDQARQLSTAVDAAITAGRVPAALQPPLRATATRLVARIRCVPPATPKPAVTPKPPKPDHHHHDRKHDGLGKKDKGGGD